MFIGFAINWQRVFKNKNNIKTWKINIISISKERKKELRRIYEEKIGKEYVKELENQPLVSPMEFVDIMSD